MTVLWNQSIFFQPNYIKERVILLQDQLLVVAYSNILIYQLIRSLPRNSRMSCDTPYENVWPDNNLILV